MKILARTPLENQIVYLYALQEGDYIAKEDSGIILHLDEEFRTQNCSLGVEKYGDSWRNDICICPNEHLVAFATCPNPQAQHPIQNQIHIVDLHVEAPPLILNEKHQSSISALDWNRNGKYLASGDWEGKVYIWNHRANDTLLRPYKHQTKITALCFDSEENYLAIGAVDGSINIYDLGLQAPVTRYTFQHNAITTLTFTQNNSLVTGTENGNINLIDLRSCSVSKTISTELSTIQHLFLTHDEKYALITDDRSNIAIYHLKNREKMFAMRSQADFQAVCFHPQNNRLTVAAKDKNLYVFDILDDGMLETLFAEQKYADIYQLAQKHKLFYESPIFQETEKIWEQTYEAGLEAVQLGDIQIIHQIFEPFSSLASKKIAIRQLKDAAKRYTGFAELVEKQRYHLAYNVTTQAPGLKLTPLYQQLEEEWKRSLRRVNTHIQQADGLEKAGKAFGHFVYVAQKKPLIQLILQERNLYFEFIKHYKEKNYHAFFQLIKEHPAFKETPEYEEILSRSHDLLEQFERLMSQERFHDAARTLQLIQNFPGLRSVVDDDKDHIDDAVRLEEDYRQGNRLACFAACASKPHLRLLSTGKKVELEWLAIMKQGKELALAEDIAALRQHFEPYFCLSMRMEKIRLLFKHVYFKQIRFEALRIVRQQRRYDKKQLSNEIDSSEIDRLSQGIQLFIHAFGYEKEIESTIKDLLQKNGISIPLKAAVFNHPDRHNWHQRLGVTLPLSIFEADEEKKPDTQNPQDEEEEEIKIDDLPFDIDLD